jgi:hypothetical protein
MTAAPAPAARPIQAPFCVGFSVLVTFTSPSGVWTIAAESYDPIDPPLCSDLMAS